LLRDQQRLPDDGGRVLDLLESFGGGGAQPHRGERRLDHVRRPEMLPVLLWERVEGHQPLPVFLEPAARTRHALLRRPRLEAALELLGLRARLRVRDPRQELPGLGLELLGQRVEHVHDAMIPAALLAHRREHRPDGAPDPQMPIGDEQPRRSQPPPLEVAEQRQLSVDSRYPLSTASTTFRPSRSPAITTSMAALSFSSPALT